ncbi:hypothetical protein KSU1_C1345 [Candidatus Jettenia caeni]|uniref:Uncharacterized protein n=1 Tax=Candidatus Jettenia caeni TaxID=247490 RepID=I3IMJ6_9BACT|nr:hypothetical protein KSU1_C1345 [Candidatus Jettenia caeni]
MRIKAVLGIRLLNEFYLRYCLSFVEEGMDSIINNTESIPFFAFSLASSKVVS